MIRTALEFIKKELEAYMVEREQDLAHYGPGNIVDLKPLMTAGGTLNIDEATHISIMLVGVEEERREGKRPYFVPVPTDNKKFYQLNAPVELELSVLFAAHNKFYETALRDLSDVVSFFQSNSVFDEQKYPSLNASVTMPANRPWQLIERLSFRLMNMSFEQQNNLWGMLGAKYLPYVVYKISMLTVFETRGKDKTAGIDEIHFKEN
ncbi:uncharacterized protein DUF4255 [Chitinophaga niastensis]|uniref:Uncharacterized protein DUF4255 n=1 Tax=Chitinophaga niastensis TaxID=536980 RepID=A0A2P8HEY7_CHINA|nr:DUF4255 domain-containing protein [Chitinophaga niastensis]PSL44788.1 uncharacterized protein DUF4255 [Chitinophaga niastensis]